MPAALGKRAKSGRRGRPHERISYEGGSSYVGKRQTRKTVPGVFRFHFHRVSEERQMTPEIQAVLNVARNLAPDESPRLLGDLETVRAVAWSRLTRPAAPASLSVPADRKMRDELLDVDKAAARLGMSA